MQSENAMAIYYDSDRFHLQLELSFYLLLSCWHVTLKTDRHVKCILYEILTIAAATNQRIPIIQSSDMMHRQSISTQLQCMRP